MLKKNDHFLMGLIPGIILPFIGYYFYYLSMFSYMSFGDYNQHLYRTGIFVSVLSLSVILNLALFFIFYKVEADKSARGVIAATFLFAFMVLYYKVLR